VLRLRFQTRGMFPGTEHDDDLRRLAVRQRGVIHRDQFRSLEVSRAHVTWLAVLDGCRAYEEFRVPRPRAQVLDAAAWQPFPRFACLMVAAAVQQRLTTAARLEEAMRSVGRIRHKSYLRLAIADMATGAESLGEIDLAQLCRRFGLAPPTRQRPRRDPSGRCRYLDSEWDLPNGEIVVLEIDGRHHLEVAQWQADIKRERSIVISRRWVLRATVFEMRLEAAAVFSDLRAMGVPT
jgi:hypothetical protein